MKEYEKWISHEVKIPASGRDLKRFIDDFVDVNERELILCAVNRVKSNMGGNFDGSNICTYKDAYQTLIQRYDITKKELIDYREKKHREIRNLGYFIPV